MVRCKYGWKNARIYLLLEVLPLTPLSNGIYCCFIGYICIYVGSLNVGWPSRVNLVFSVQSSQIPAGKAVRRPECWREHQTQSLTTPWCMMVSGKRTSKRPAWSLLCGITTDSTTTSLGVLGWVQEQVIEREITTILKKVQNCHNWLSVLLQVKVMALKWTGWTLMLLKQPCGREWCNLRMNGWKIFYLWEWWSWQECLDSKKLRHEKWLWTWRIQCVEISCNVKYIGANWWFLDIFVEEDKENEKYNMLAIVKYVDLMS